MKLQRREILFACIATIALATGYFASDLYLPALPLIRDYFHVTVSQTQQTLSAYFLGFAITQMVTGPIIDHYGYRKIALGLCLGLLVASILCAFANSLYFLIAGRFLQALFAGALSIIARASFVKYFSEEKALDVYLLIAPAVSLSPAIAPVIGGYLAHQFNWRATFVFMVAFVFLLFISLYFVFRFKETRPADSSIHPIYILKTYISLLKNKVFCGYLALQATSFAAYFAYITEAPFIFHQAHYSTKEIGYTFFPMAFAFLISSQLVRRLLKVVDKHRLIKIGLTFALLGYLSLTLVEIMHWPVYLIMVMMSVTLFGNGFIAPPAFSSGMTLFPHRSGYAASLLAAIPFIFSTLSSLSVHTLCGNSLMALSWFCGGIVLVGLVLFIVLTRPK